MGCFVANVGLELAPRDAGVRQLAQKALAGQEQMYAALLEKAKSDGEISSATDIPRVAKTLLSLVLGLRILARAGTALQTIRVVREQTEKLFL